MAVGLGLVLLERALCQFATTERADEVLRMELVRHGAHAATVDRLVARVAQRSLTSVIVRLAVRLAIVLEEGARRKSRLALLQYSDYSTPHSCAHTTYDHAHNTRHAAHALTWHTKHSGCQCVFSAVMKLFEMARVHP